MLMHNAWGEPSGYSSLAHIHIPPGPWCLVPTSCPGISFVLIYKSPSGPLVLSSIPVRPLRTCSGPRITEKLSQTHLQDIHAAFLFLCLSGHMESFCCSCTSWSLREALWGHLRHHLPKHTLRSLFPRVLPFSTVLSGHGVHVCCSQIT